MNYKHGDARKGQVHRLHNTWRAAIGRCENTGNNAYPAYGGRGIKICPEWRLSYSVFRDWALANGFEASLTLDRADNDGDYSPDNCRWVGRKEQARNRRSSRFITHAGKTQTLAAWSEESGVRVDTLHRRLGMLGWTIHRALTAPIQGQQIK